MGLSDKIEDLKSGKDMTEDKSCQLRAIDDIEKILRDIGISLEPKFEIPLSTRIGATTKTN
jgi:hypothetical protein